MKKITDLFLLLASSLVIQCNDLSAEWIVNSHVIPGFISRELQITNHITQHKKMPMES